MNKKSIVNKISRFFLKENVKLNLNNCKVTCNFPLKKI